MGVTEKLQETLLAYAKEYLAKWPESETRYLPEIRPLDVAVTAALDYDDWYCEKFEEAPNAVLFYTIDPGINVVIGKWIADVDLNTVKQLA